MIKSKFVQPVDILLVEDNPGDARLTMEALQESKIQNVLHHVKDGIEAMDFLKKTNGYEDASRPDVILLDLNLPRMDGREVLQQIKSDESLKRIPVVVLTTSQSEEDILKSYNYHANCYITKPINFDQFIKVVQSIKDFWFSIVKLPSE